MNKIKKMQEVFMPIYEFECKDCDMFFEAFLLKSEEKVFCPNCKSENVIKLISAPNVSGTTQDSAGCGGHSTGFS